MQLPTTVDPIKLAKQQSVLNGALLLSRCERLQAICEQVGEVSVSLQFGQDAARIYFIQGEITGVLNAICQRCNQMMQLPIQATFMLSPVVSEARAKNLPDNYEPVFMEDELVNLHEMVEDELLLVLPMVPKHEICTAF